jgi:hypothetical protein
MSNHIIFIKKDKSFFISYVCVVKGTRIVNKGRKQDVKLDAVDVVSIRQHVGRKYEVR